jgi:hypothetical protein
MKYSKGTRFCATPAARSMDASACTRIMGACFAVTTASSGGAVRRRVK